MRDEYNYAEDALPDDQPVIKTSNLTRTMKFVGLLTDPENRYHTIAVITASAGEGKSLATRYCQEMLELKYQTALPVSIRVKIMPRSTPRSLSDDISAILGERPKRETNVYRISQESAKSIRGNDTKLVIFDEANRLRDDTFEVVRYLIDKAGCPILIVGLPNVLNVIERHQQFSSRVGMRMHFEPLTFKEVMNVVLPQMVFPRWAFDPENEQDRLMGEEIWRKVRPSLRSMRNLLDMASKIAKAKQEPKITLTSIREAYRWVDSQEEQQRNRPEKQPPPGTHEQKSEERHEGKEEKDKEHGGKE